MEENKERNIVWKPQPRQLEAQEQPAPPKLSGPAKELSTAAMARAMKMQKGEMR